MMRTISISIPSWASGIASADIMRKERTTSKLLKRRFIWTIFATIVLSFFPLALLALANVLFPDPLSSAPSAYDRLREDPHDIYFQDYIENDGSAAVVDKDLNVTELGGPAIFGKDKITAEEWGEFLSLEATKYQDTFAYYDGAEPYWLILRAPANFRYVLSINFDSDMPSTYPTAGLILGILVVYFAVLISFGVIYSSKTAKDIKAIEAEEEKKRMLLVSEISHDLKTPLASVQGYSEMLLEKKVNDETRQDYLKLIHDNSVRTNEILQSLFMYSKLESAGYQIKPERTDICEFTRLIIAQYITKFEDAGFSYEFDVPEEEIFADIDGELMRRVFDNLLENSLKYNSRGTKILIGVTGGKQVEITVADNGRGIPSEHKDKIFEPFYRADQESKGSGLGLAIVKQIVEMHGGKIVLVPSEGCKWLITLPLTKI